MRQLLFDAAAAAGFDEVRLVSPRPFSRWQSDAAGLQLCSDASALMAGVESIAVLFRRYMPHMGHWAQYYICSNEGYLAAKGLAQTLEGHGLSAVANPSLPHRAAALRSGGVLGKNGLYIHPELGTRFSLHLLLLRGITPDEDGGVLPCGERCSLCVEACPGGALSPFCRERCIRHHLSGGVVSEWLRPGVRRILGCDICQDCCPHNQPIGFGEAEPAHAHAMDIGRLLGGDIAAARELVGSNYGRKKRLASQAALLVGAQRLGQYTPLLKPLAADEYEPLARHAGWALERLG